MLHASITLINIVLVNPLKFDNLAVIVVPIGHGVSHHYYVPVTRISHQINYNFYLHQSVF